MKNYFYISLAAIILFAGCGRTETIVEIDNPTSKTIKFKIDDKHYSVYKNHTGKYSLYSGKHTLKMGKNITEFTIEKGKKYFINPTKSQYIIEDIIYTNEIYYNLNNVLDSIKSKEISNVIDKRLGKKTTQKTKDTILIVIDSLIVFPYSGNFSKIDEVVIEKIWDYGLESRTPKSLKSREYSVIKKKIYRYSTYKSYITKELNKKFNELKKTKDISN